VFALISHGSNGHGAYSRNGVTMNAGSVNTNELTNCHCNSSAVATTYAPTYVRMQQTLDSGNALDNFDDLVSHKERWQMQTSGDKTGSCQFIYVADDGNTRVQKFDMSGNFLTTFGSKSACQGCGNGQFDYLYDVTVDPSGNVWAADWYGFRVEKFDSNGNYLTQIGSYPFDSGYATSDTSGNIWASDSAAQGVKEFNSSGTLLLQFGSSGSGNGQFNNPNGIAIDKSGNVWVADKGNYRVQKFDSNGNFLLSFGSYGAGNGQFESANFVTVDSSGNIWVNNEYPVQVQKFDSNGNFVNTYFCYGSGNGQFVYPEGIAFDSNGNMYVADYGNNRVQKFDSNGNYLSQFGTAGSGNGQFNGPSAIAITTR